MKITKKVQSILLPFVLLIGVTGCMNEKSSENAILTYLEETYNETFEVETFKEGSTIFKNMYGADKVIVHPKGKPEHVFLAGEDRDHEGEYYDTYVLSKWAVELTKKFETEISTILPEEVEYRILLYVEDGKYDSTMKEMSVFDYFTNVNNDADVVINMAVKKSSPPDVTSYYEPVYQMLQLLDTLGVVSYGVSIGFVDSNEETTDYIRTSNVNNVPWTNFDGKVYGTIMVDEHANITDSNQIKDYYEVIEE
ncbi:hypothetical protein ABLO26_26445 [Neobacillus sp. 179-J 1A1 HS]|uniref:hypothetical protein n=1 Tax=Neobacillus driksii TaxID=3035913 RepID=UPI0035BC82F2